MTGAPLRVAVIGAGAVGSLLGGCLALAGHDVTLVARRPPAGTGSEVALARGGRVRLARVRRLAADDELGDPLDVAIVAVKQFDLAAALERLRGRPAAVVVTVQNGIGAEDEALAARPDAGLIAGSLTAAVEIGPRGEVRWETRGGIGLAPVNGGVAPIAARLAGAFALAGLPAAVLSDAREMKWSKLLANLVGNATSALLDTEVRAILADRRLYEVERAQQREALAVMAVIGLRPTSLPGANVPLLVRGFALPGWVGRPVLARLLGRARGAKAPSLRLAMRAEPGPGRPGAEAGPERPATGPGPERPGAGSRPRTEVEWLNGAVAGEAARHGIATPVNSALCRLVLEAAADPADRAQFAGRPDRLLEALARET